MRSAPPPLAGNSASVLGVGDASRALVFRRVLPRPVEKQQSSAQGPGSADWDPERAPRRVPAKGQCLHTDTEGTRPPGW